MKFKKILLSTIALLALYGVASCGGNSTNTNTMPSDTNPNNPGFVDEDRADYDLALGEFYEIYSKARENVDNIALRYAEMAIAEAKLLESGVMLPTSTEGGNYSISKVVPKTAPFTLWGNDYDKLHTLLVTNEPIKAEDREVMIKKWEENRTKEDFDYRAWAKEYLKGKDYTLKNTYTTSYSSDVKNWDVLATSRAADSKAIINTYSGLYEYDVQGNLMPALAESHTVSEDGLTYTFKIRQEAVWVDSQGRRVADIQADDFVAGFQHMLDAAGGLEYLVQGVVVNASEYLNGEITNFNDVGVKALDKYTLEYTLCEPTPYFITMLGYNVFAPLCRTYYQSKGGSFGFAYDPTSASYTYAKDKDSIAYCGPYVLTNVTVNNTIRYEKNDSYWNADNVDINTITWLYNDGKDATKSYNDYMAGATDGTGLNTQGLQLAKQDGIFNTYAYITETNSTTFSNFMNVKRQAFVNVQDGKGAASNKTQAQRVQAQAAMKNQKFRLALAFATDRKVYNAATVGNELAEFSLRNSYTPYNFVSLPEDVIVEINGVETSFKKGTLFGEIVQAQLDADNCPIIAFDKTRNSGDGYDGWYNPLNAKEYLETAIEELAAEGVEISREKPVYIDMPYYSASPIYEARGYAVKNSIEASLEGKVIVNLINCQIDDDWFNCGYYTNSGAEANYDMYDLSGWGPDYGDPQTYLDTFLPEGAGYMTKCIGLY